MIRIEAYGKPEPKGSFRAVRRGNFAGLIPDNEKTAPWAAVVREAARKTCQTVPVFLSEPLRLGLEFRLPRPKSHYKKDGTLRPSAPTYHANRPDADKLERAVCDAIKDVVYHDDGQVAVVAKVKRYIHPGEEPGVTITVEAVQ